MAQKYITQFVDDIDGSEATETVTFGLDGKTFTIDLSAENAAALRDAVSPYATAARRDGGKVKPAVSIAAKRTDLTAIRVWANGNGFTVADRGRIPSNVVEAYDAAS